jgi:diguanylate cyclase
MSGANDSKWKEKYLRSLDQLEQKEQQWIDAEDMLRRAVGRLAHTGYGADRLLDKQLDKVRDAVRGKRDAKTLETLVREASETAVSLQETQHQASLTAIKALANIVEHLPLTGAKKKEANRLQKQLASLDSLANIEPLMAAIAGLVEKAETPDVAANPATAPTAEAESPRRGGFLSRFIPTKEVATEPPATDMAAAATADRPRTAANTLERLLDKLDAGADWQTRVSSLRHQALACRDEAEALQLIEEVAALISEMARLAESADPQARTIVESLPAAGDALVELLHKLEIPSHLKERLGVIKQSLAAARTPQQISIVVGAIANLMAEVRREVQSEKHELELFIESVTSRIQTLSEHVTELGSNRKASGDSRTRFQQSLRDHMDGIRTSVQESNNIDSLKRAIESGLDAIEQQMTQYVDREDDLTRQANERIEDLSSRLHDMQHEAFLLQKKVEQQRDIAMTDPLTGVCNRLAYEEHIEAEYQRWKRYHEPVSLLIIDIDHFKRINDTFGHLAGDKALKALAARLRQQVREVDIVARYGGEEFVVIMPSTDIEKAYVVAEKLRSTIASAGFHYRQKPVNITVSCGLASFRQGDDAAAVFQRADDALYGAKKAGRNRTHRENEADLEDHAAS